MYSSKKMNKWICFYYYETHFHSVFWKKLKSTKRHFEINWPLGMKIICLLWQCGLSCFQRRDTKLDRFWHFWQFGTISIHKVEFLWVCWFKAKNLVNFVSLLWKLVNPYCHKWYFVTKIVLTYCEKKCSSNRENLSFANS